MSPSLDDAPDLSGLIELSRVEHLDLKPVILRVQTDLFVSGGVRDRAAVQSFEALAGGLIPTVDDDTAETVARKLAPHPETPESILIQLVARGGLARDIVVAQVPRLGTALMTAALADGAEIGPAMAARADLGRAHLADLSARGDPAIDLALAGNPHLALPNDIVRSLVGRAKQSPDRARALLARADLAPADLAPLFLFADVAQRETIARAVAATAALRPCPAPPREAGAILTGFSGRGDIAGFVSALGDLLALPKGFLAKAPDASLRYDLLTLALRAAGLEEEEAVYVFLTLNETVARSVDRVFDLVRLFRTTPRPAARDLLSSILDVTLSERTGTAEAHQAYQAPDAARPRTTPATERAPVRPALPSRSRRTS